MMINASGYAWFTGGQYPTVTYCNLGKAQNRYSGAGGSDTFHFSYCHPTSGSCGCCTLSSCQKTFSWSKAAVCP